MSGLLDSFMTDIARATGQLEAMDRAIQASLPEVAETGAGILLEEALMRVPVRMGYLRASGKKKLVKSTATMAQAKVSFGNKKAWYAHFVEYGRRKRPYLRPAVDSARPRIVRVMQDIVMARVRLSRT